MGDSTAPGASPDWRAAVLGSPVGHSLSPVLHTAAYAALGVADHWSYGRHECDEHGLAGFLDACDDSWAGLSLTMPLKRVALQVSARASDLAVQVGAANTLVHEDDGTVPCDCSGLDVRDAPGESRRGEEGILPRPDMIERAGDSNIDTVHQRTGGEQLLRLFAPDGFAQDGFRHAHGGIVATVLDEAMGKVNKLRSAVALTSQMKVEYFKPVPLSKPLLVESYEVRHRGRRHTNAAEIRNQKGELLARNPFRESEYFKRFAAPSTPLLGSRRKESMGGCRE